MLIATLVLTAVFALLLQATGEVSVAEGIATGIAGFVAPLLVQVLKKLTDTSGFKALLISVAVSAAVALVAMYVAGEIASVGDAVKQITSVFGIATIVYNAIKAAGGS